MVVRESSAEEGISMEKLTTFLGRTKPSMAIPGNDQLFVVGHGSGTADPLLLSSLKPCHEPRHCLTKPLASVAVRLRKSELESWLCTGLLHDWHKVTFVRLCLVLLLCSWPTNWNCQICRAARLLLYSRFVHASAIKSCCALWIADNGTHFVSLVCMEIHMHRGLPSSPRFHFASLVESGSGQEQKPCVEASLCQPHSPTPKMFMSGSTLAKVYRGLRLFRAASMWKGGKTKIKQET